MVIIIINTYFSGSLTFSLNKPTNIVLLSGNLSLGEGILPAIETILLLLLMVTSGGFSEFIPGVWAIIMYDLYQQSKERNQQ